ncbi:hypothetical protein F3N42_08435 [Marinihelvus fidelis]|uniref:Uncharacterized protein n=1 Tax=Marinihelvus fidelis TaxID=2613842 RepID=A0A5N0T8S0_9GAMM|nr:hypothetical protein [Marinihelvus fidelis]KAA9131340.1 hypothetical protein F3N42_08435 [Marinihelvus fidelis]
MSLVAELKRRNVFKVAIAYAVTAWVLLQATEVVSDILELPAWAPKLILLILVVGFVPALIIAWAFELTPDGVKLESEVDRSQSVTRKTGRKLDFIIMALLGLSLAYFIWESRFKQAADMEVANPTPVTQGTPAEPAEPVRQVPTERAEANRNSIAVLPFANRSAEAADAYFTDGIHDDLLTQLSKIGEFSVISRTSVMEYRDTTKNLRDIAGELDVAHIMEGAVQRAGNRVRINVQLIDATTDEHLWAEIYDRELTTDNLFDIQSEIAIAIAGALSATLTDRELAAMSEAPTANVAAYELYLQARQLGFEQDQLSNQTALELAHEALRLDPEFKLAWVTLAEAQLTRYWWYSGGDPEMRGMARESINRARALDDDFPELFMAEGLYWYWGHLDYERAIYNFGQAIERAPNDAAAYYRLAWASRRGDQWEQTVDAYRQGLRLDPRIAHYWGDYGLTLTLLHRYDEAMAAHARARALEPDSHLLRALEALTVLQATGNTEAAIGLSTGAQHTTEWDNIDTYIAVRLAADRFEEALATIQKMDARMEVQRQLIALREDQAAQVYHFMGDFEASSAAADAAWFRLQGLRETLGEDYRILLAEARVSALRGEVGEPLQRRVTGALDAQPPDGVESKRVALEAARIYAMADMGDDAVSLLEPLFQPPSLVSVHTVGTDPAFDGIRESPAFIAMMERVQ